MKKEKSTICLVLDKNLKEQLEKEADDLGITTLAYIRIILKKRKKVVDKNYFE